MKTELPLTRRGAGLIFFHIGKGRDLEALDGGAPATVHSSRPMGPWQSAATILPAA